RQDRRPCTRRIAVLVRRDRFEAIFHRQTAERLRQDAVEPQGVEERPAVGNREPVAIQRAVDVGQVVIAADRRELRVEARRRTDENAEPAAAQRTYPAAKLDAKPLEPELLELRDPGGVISTAGSGDELIRLGRLLREPLHSAGKGQRLADLIRDRLQRKLA